MRLNADEFNEFLGFMGQSFTMRRGYACPCVNKASGQPNPTCPRCLAKGRFWDGPVLPGIAGVVSQQRLRNYAQFGPFDQDDMLLSIPSDSALYAIGQYDRVEALNRTEPFSINFVRGLNDPPKFTIISIERAFYFDDDTEIVELAPVVTDGALD